MSTQIGASTDSDEERYQAFLAVLHGARGEEMEPSMDKDEALRMVKAGSENFEDDEMEAYLARMVEEGRLMMMVRGKLFFQPQ